MFRAPFAIGGYPGGIPAESVSLLAQNPAAIRLPASPLCEHGRPYVTDPCTGQAICLCQLSGDPTPHGPAQGPPDAVRNLQHPSGLPMGTEPSAFKSPLTCGIRGERPESWKSLPSTISTHPYDPSLAFHPYNAFYAGLDLNSAARRKAATRETTSPLKAWLSEHRKNPYPTKAEKIMLAIITKMTLTQVSTWFANARRRLKKENKLCWDSGDDKDDEDDDVKSNDDDVRRSVDSDREIDVEGVEKRLSDDEDSDTQLDLSDISDAENEPTESSAYKLHSRLLPSSQLKIPENILTNKPVNTPEQRTNSSSDENRTVSKPKIWSISQIIDTDKPKPVSQPQPVFTAYNTFHHSSSSYPIIPRVPDYSVTQTRLQAPLPVPCEESHTTRPTLDTPPDTPPFSGSTKQCLSPVKSTQSSENDQVLNLKTEKREPVKTHEAEKEES